MYNKSDLSASFPNRSEKYFNTHLRRKCKRNEYNVKNLENRSYLSF